MPLEQPLKVSHSLLYEIDDHDVDVCLCQVGIRPDPMERTCLSLRLLVLMGLDEENGLSVSLDLT